MIIHFQKILFLKEFLVCNGCFELFTKIKKGSGTSFWCKFSAWFFYKNVPYLILYPWIKFQCQNFFPSQDIKQNVSLGSYLNSWWRHKPKAPKQWLIGKKEGKMEIQKFEYVEYEKRFLNEIKNIFHSFWRAIILWKMKIS